MISKSRYVMISLFATSPLAVWAQVVPSSAQPGRTPDQIQLPTPPIPKLAPAIEQNIKGQDIPVGGDDIRFTLRSVEVTGSTVYSQETFKSLYQGSLGKNITFQDAYRIAARITNIYRKDGYLLSQAVIPEQEVADGNLTIRVVEGFVGKVYFQGEDGQIHDPTRIQKGIAGKILSSKPLSMPVLEKNLLLLNELPGQTFRAILKASPDTPGATDVYILSDHKRINGYMQADNRGTRYQGPVEFMSGISVNQVFDDTDQISGRIATTYQTHELKFGEISYQKTLTPEGLKLSITANRNLTHPGADLKPFDIEGEDNLYEARLNYPLQRSRTMSTDFYTTFDWRDISTDALGTELSKDHLRTLRAGLTGQRRDEWYGVNTLNAELTQGLDIFNASGKNSGNSRPAASSGYQKLLLQLSREQAIPQTQWSIFGSLSGQHAPRPLPASEEFGLGGERFGSAYDSSELTGDSGIAGRIEARYLYIPSNNKLIKTSQPYVFYDVGRIHNIDPGNGQKSGQSLASAGAGIRMNMAENYSIALEGAQPLSKDVSALHNHSPRVFFKVSKVF